VRSRSVARARRASKRPNKRNGDGARGPRRVLFKNPGEAGTKQSAVTSLPLQPGTQPTPAVLALQAASVFAVTFQGRRCAAWTAAQATCSPTTGDQRASGAPTTTPPSDQARGPFEASLPVGPKRAQISRMSPKEPKKRH